MKKSPIDWLIESFFVLVIGSLAVMWVAFLLKGFWGVLVMAVTDPFKFVALLIVLWLLYLWKKEQIHGTTAILRKRAGFKKKMSK